MNESIPFEEHSIDFRRYLAALQSWLWLIVFIAVLSGGAAYFISQRQTPVYLASTTMLINAAPLTQATNYDTILTTESIGKTYAQLMKKGPALNGVVQKLGLKTSAAALASMITVTPVPGTLLIQVDVQDTDPTRAAQIANTLVEVFSQQIQDNQAQRYAASKQSLQTQMGVLESQIQDLRDELVGEKNKDARDRLEDKISQHEQSYNNLALSYEGVRLTEAQTISSAMPVEEAIVPTAPIRPRTTQNTLLAVVAGTLLAIMGVFLIDALDDSIRNPEDITNRFHLPILAVIAHHRLDADGPVTQISPRSPVTEAFRALRTNLQYASPNKPIRRLLITSPTPANGKTTVAANLAIVAVQGGQRIVLVDADLHRPRLHKVLGGSNHYGLSTLFARTGFGLRDMLQTTKIQGLRVLFSGPIPDNPSEMLGSHRMGEILERLDADYDLVIIDSPPALSVTDAAVLAPQVDAILLVVKPDTCNLTTIKQTLEQFKRVGGNVVGIALNEIETKSARYSYHYKNYAYYQIYHDDYAPPSKNGHGKNGKVHVDLQEVSAKADSFDLPPTDDLKS